MMNIRIRKEHRSHSENVTINVDISIVHMAPSSSFGIYAHIHMYVCSRFKPTSWRCKLFVDNTFRDAKRRDAILYMIYLSWCLRLGIVDSYIDHRKTEGNAGRLSLYISQSFLNLISRFSRVAPYYLPAISIILHIEQTT